MKRIINGLLAWAVLALMAIQPAAAGFRNDTYGNISGRSSEYLSQGETSNCKLAISGTTLSIVGDNDAALSTSNPCLAGVRNSDGTTSRARFTSPIQLTFGASSDTDSNLFGIVDADWASPMPMRLGIVWNGTVGKFLISRIGHNMTGSASVLCQKGDTDCDTRSDELLIDSGLTLTEWESLPVTQVGWFTATYATTGGAWTFAISGSQAAALSGFNEDYQRVRWTFPAGQQGAAANTYIGNNGTPPTQQAPIFSNNDYSYKVTPSGVVCIDFNLDGDGGSDGAGAVNAVLAIPYEAQHAFDSGIGLGYTSYSAGATSAGLVGELSDISVPGITLINASTGANITNANFSNGARRVTGNACYASY